MYSAKLAEAATENNQKDRSIESLRGVVASEQEKQKTGEVRLRQLSDNMKKVEGQVQALEKSLKIAQV